MAIKKTVAYLEKKVKQIKKSLRPFKNYNFITPEYSRRQEARFKKLIAASSETAKEKKLFKAYEKMVKESFKKENVERKFRLSHVEQLGIEHQIFFLYSKKDIGKTRQLGKLLVDIKAKDPTANVVFIRNTKEELEGWKKTMNDSMHWPTWTNGEHVYWKDEVKKKGVSKAKPCGFMAYSTGYGFIKWQGSEFDNVKFWMWDECNSVEGGLTFEVFMRINVFLSSIIRDKRGVKGFMFGNLLEKSNIFLARLGVGSHTRLKIFKVHENDDPNKPVLSTLLYMNTGDLFEGIEKQQGLATQFLEEDESISLLSNRPGMLEIKSQYEELDLKKYLPIFSFVFRRTVEVTLGKSRKKDYILYIYKIPNSLRFVCWIDLFKVGNVKPGFRWIVTDDKVVSNSYEFVISQEEEDFGSTFIEPLGDVLDAGELWFGWNGSQEIFEDMWPSWQSKYLKIDEKSI